MKILITVLVTVGIILLLGLIVIYSGVVNVSVLEPTSGLTKWALSTTMENSVEARADGIEVPDLQSEQMIREGAEHYIEMCQGCHGAPGHEDSELARGLEPQPPHLYEKEESEEFSPAQKFWITKHGVMMTGMPAWGRTHSDQKIWNMVAFIEKLPEMTPEEFNTMYAEITAAASTEQAEGEEEAHQHDHE